MTLLCEVAQPFIVDPRKSFTELRRRNVYRAGVIYTMTAWLLIQIAPRVFPFFDMPNWVVQLVIMRIVIGFRPLENLRKYGARI